MSTLPRETWHLDTAHIGPRVLFFDHLESTNSTAAELASHDSEPLVVIADYQTSGRGQYGRVWQARPGSSLLMSVALRPPPELCRPVILTAFTAVAVAEAIFALTGSQARVKWPNDLLIRGKKVCGILIESAAATVIGIGLNLSQTAEEFASAELPDATSLGMHGGNLTPQPPSLRGKGTFKAPLPAGEGLGRGLKDLTPQPPSLRGKGEFESPSPIAPPSLRGKGAGGLGGGVGEGFTPISVATAANAVIRKLDAEYARLLAGERVAVEADWKWRIGLLGRQVTVELTDGTSVTGRLREMGFDGLELETGDRGFLAIVPETVRHITPEGERPVFGEPGA